MDLEISMPLSDLSIEDFKNLIHGGGVKGEVPFDLLVEHYPELLSEWYPGYPGVSRKSTSSDPTPMRCYVKNGEMTFHTPGIEPSTYPVENDIPDGTYYVWVSTIDGRELSVHGFYTHLNEQVQSAVDLICSRAEGAF